MPEKILIVDDDVDSLKLIGLMLQRNGYEVVAANTGGQALAKATKELPHLIILDVMMPDMNGYEVCRRLRAEDNTREIPIIMFTAKTLIDDKVAGFEAGADDYLTKPTHPNELISRVKSMLQRSNVQHQKEPERGMAVGVLGTKGGVGTSSVALNLAAAFLKAGEETIITDFRPGQGNLGLLLGMNTTTGMANVLRRPPGELNAQAIEEELVTHQSGLRALLSSARPRETQLKIPLESAQTIVHTLRALGKPVVIDLGSGYTGLLNALQPQIERLLVLVEPFPATVSMTKALITELESAGTWNIDVVVVNRDQSNEGQMPWQEIETTLGRELRAVISAAPAIMSKAAEAATPAVIHQPNAIVATQIVKLAESIIGSGIKSLSNRKIKT
jgi:pilus assembly protein CpaE